MTGDTIVLVFLALALICGGIVALLQAHMARQYGAMVRRHDEHERLVRKLDAMLTAWAVYGEWPPACRVALLNAMRLGDARDDSSDSPADV